MPDEKPSLGYNPLDPRDRAERGRERAAWFRRSDMMGAVTFAMIVFVALAILRKDLALAYLLCAMGLPILIYIGLILLGLLMRRFGRLDPVPARPGPVMLVALSTAVFFAAADSFSLSGLCGMIALLILSWQVYRKQPNKGGGHD